MNFNWSRVKSLDWKALLWILSLAVLSVGAKNFEEGLSIDGPLYAAISRNIARTGELFHLYGNIPDFDPFAEHPHLGFWLVALIFKFLPAADWSARIAGHLFYVSFLWVFYLWLKRLYSEKVATLAVFFLWIWPMFSNFFSNFYLDPGALFLGTVAVISLWKALEKNSYAFSFLSGLCLTLCFAYKGLTVLGFFPIIAYLFVHHAKSVREFLVHSRHLLSLGFGLLLSAALYYWLVRESSVPNFFEIYWQRQVAQRFGRTLSLGAFFNWRFFVDLTRDTHFFFILALFTLPAAIKKKEIRLPWVFLLSFYLLYAPTERIRGQYWLMVMPAAAWLIALATERFLKSPDRLKQITQVVAVAAVAVIQYTPMKTHHRSPPGEVPLLTKLKK